MGRTRVTGRRLVMPGLVPNWTDSTKDATEPRVRRAPLKPAVSFKMGLI
jgi:hypothetical protein